MGTGISVKTGKSPTCTADKRRDMSHLSLDKVVPPCGLDTTKQENSLFLLPTPNLPGRKSAKLNINSV
ncbi:hypothetical protein NIES3974_47560 [Calothrix sp. NIES-3974]|nr:hypothetical protein NIES3974_47560 [Calothrix sp. NIES-3974]